MIKITMLRGEFKHEITSLTKDDAYHAMEQAYAAYLEPIMGAIDPVLIANAVELGSKLTEKEIKDDVGTGQNT